jgi:radical SAM protein with 4Fe4S-binding SPASM domain
MNEIDVSLLDDPMALLSKDLSNFWIYASGNNILVPYPYSCVITTSPCRVYPLNEDGFKALKAIENGAYFRDIVERLGIESNISKTNLISFIQKSVRARILSLDEERAGTIHLKEQILDPPVERIFIEITSRCNLHCVHCYLSSSDVVEEQGLTLEEITAIVNRADELGIYRFDITGGELFVREDVKEILKIFKDKSMMVNILTNGTLLSPELCEFLYGLGNIHTIFISLDDIDETEHDAFRGKKGAFKKTIAGIKHLKERNFNIILNITLVKNNLPKIPEIIEFARTTGVGFRFAPILPVGRGEALINEVPDIEQVSLMEFRGQTTGTKSAIHYSCGVGDRMLFIRSNGEISLCPTLTSRESPIFKLGQVQEDDLKDVWEGSEVLQLFRRTGCHRSDCRHGSECHGGCRSRAFINSGDLSAKDLIACAYFRLKESAIQK